MAYEETVYSIIIRRKECYTGKGLLLSCGRSSSSVLSWTPDLAASSMALWMARRSDRLDLAQFGTFQSLATVGMDSILQMMREKKRQGLPFKVVSPRRYHVT